jgi:hypothetical protein
MTCTGQTDPCTKRSIGRTERGLTAPTPGLYHALVWNTERGIAGSLWVGVATLLWGCASPPGGLDSPVPVEQLDAIAKVAREKDRQAIPKLIGLLNSDDPVVRLSAIRTLESLTGQTLGYDHAAPEYRRRQMVQAWADWYNQQGQPPNLPQSPDRNGGPGSQTRPGSEIADTVS